MNLAMNSAMNNAMQNANNGVGTLTGKAGSVAPVVANGVPTALAPDAQVLPDGAAAPGEALRFGHWIATGEALPDDAVAAPPDAAAPASDEEPREASEALDDSPVPAVMLAAMAPMIAPAALPAMMLAMPGMKPAIVDDSAAAPASESDGVSVAGEAPRAVATSAGARVAAPELSLPVALPAVTPAASARPDVVAVQAAAATTQPYTAPAADVATPDAVAEIAPAPPAASGTGVNAATGQGARGADNIVLAGPPTAWRQVLHEALGERLQLQLGRNIDQATIRLDPPMLGRIEIAIRHSGGNLEVHIAASNTEVLRQLNTVSDTLRSDLAGRQYSSVSVNVTEVPRAQASAQPGAHTPGQGNPDAQGRPRQDQPRTPGLALADGGDAASPFSMN